MGACLADAALRRGHQVTIVSGPVGVDYPPDAQVIPVVTTDDMLREVNDRFGLHDGLIGAAAPCDYMPKRVSESKLTKDGSPLKLELVETADVVATAARNKRSDQWVVGFALETEDRRFRAVVKMQRKCCDLMVSNGPAAIDSPDNDVEILAADGLTIARAVGDKQVVADAILSSIHATLLTQPDTLAEQSVANEPRKQ